MAKPRKTGKSVAQIASKVLKSDKYSKDIKKLAASALSQRAPKKKK